MVPGNQGSAPVQSSRRKPAEGIGGSRLRMSRSSAFWILAILITFAAAYYQRRTGPTYPIRGKAEVNARKFFYRLERSHDSQSNCPVRIRTDDPAVSGIVEWKRHGLDEPFVGTPMAFDQGTLMAELPHQPPAGKLDYRVILIAGSGKLVLPEKGPAVIRFKGEVPYSILIPHILAMFIAMLLSNRAGLEIFNPKPRLKTLTYGTLGFLSMGGLILGPIVQKYAFGAYWTGWPFGIDLTDNKTFLALLGWVAAAIALRRAKRPEIWTAAASVVLLAVYMIPHSVLGSERKYDRTEQSLVLPCYARVLAVST